MTFDYDAFTKEVCECAWKSTNAKDWNDEVIDWFWRMDFDPSRWQDDYLEFVSKK